MRSFTFLVATLSMCLGMVPQAQALDPSRAISHYVAYPLPDDANNSTFVTIADLASKNSTGRDNQIRTVARGRIMISAQIHISNPGGVAVRGACQLLMSNGVGPLTGLKVVSPRNAVWYTTDNAAYDLTVPLLGYAVMPPGKYNVVVRCEQLAFTGRTTASLDHMLVWQ
jgi:hypothetical protein